MRVLDFVEDSSVMLTTTSAELSVRYSDETILPSPCQRTTSPRIGIDSLATDQHEEEL